MSSLIFLENRFSFFHLEKIGAAYDEPFLFIVQVVEEMDAIQTDQNLLFVLFHFFLNQW